MSYHVLASWYDDLMEHVPYEKWIAFTEEQLKKHQINGKKLVDLGCGTGEISIRFAERNFNVSAVDLSEDMLMVGTDKALQRQLNIQWIQQNIIELEGFTDIDVFVSFLDVVNYITTERDVQQFFKRVYEALASNGLFIFDVHHLPFMIQERMNQTFVDETAMITYIWECVANNNRGSMTHYLTFFIKQENGLYEKYDEIHDQQVYPVEVYKYYLEKAGFTKIEILPNILDEHLIMDVNNPRNFIIARK